MKFPSEPRYRPKGVFGKGVGNSKNASEMRQKCVRNASKMRQSGSCLLGKEERSKMRQKCVKIASKMRQNGRYREPPAAAQFFVGNARRRD